MEYIWANIHPTTHLWSFCYLDNKKNFRTIELERLDRYKNSPNLSNFWLIPQVENHYKEKIINYFWISDFNNLKTLNFDDNNILKKHHYLHACSVFYSNKIKESVILCIDNHWYDIDFWNQFQTIWNWINDKIDLKYSTKIKSQLDRWIGFWYWIISDFLWLQEGSVMWLSAYWNKDFYHDVQIYEYRDNGVYFNRKLLKHTIANKVENIDFLKEYDIFDEINWNRKIILSNIKNIFWITNEDIINSKEDILNSKFIHIAAALQYQTEEAILYLAKKAYKITGSKNLCLAWGVALNILANTRILKETEFENIYISPVSEDIGLALWSFYHLYHIQEKNKKRIYLESTWYWNTYSKKEILFSLEKFNDYIIFDEKDEIEIYDIVTDKLIDNKIIGWFNWSSEFWPRALWNRSIIASPSSKILKDRVNKIKSRELWRPIAPSILEEDIWKYFNTEVVSPFMSFSWDIKQSKLSELEWVVHIDWTSRFQSVSTKNNIRYYNLIKKFKEKTGISVITNTSMNVSREPIIETPEESLKMFLSTDLDFLVIDNFFIKKRKNNLSFKFDYEDIRLKRNLLFEDNKKSLCFKKEIFSILNNIFSDYELRLENHFYDNNIIFYINNEKYILEKFRINKIYLFTDKKIWLKKIWVYHLIDEKIINILFNNNNLIDFLNVEKYILKDY